MMTHSTRKLSPPLQCGFSLVELVLALGIITFAGMALVGLFSVGLNTNHSSSEELKAAMVAESILAVRRAMPVADLDCPLPPLNQQTNVPRKDAVFLTEDGSRTNDRARAKFRMSYSVEPYTTATPTNPVAKQTSRVVLSLTWPAGARPEAPQGRFEVTSVFALPE